MPRSAFQFFWGGGYFHKSKVKSLEMGVCVGGGGGGGGRFSTSQKWKVLKCQDLPKFQFSGGGGEFSTSQKWKVLKCQDLPKFQFSGGEGVFSISQKWKVLKCQDLPKFQFSGGGGYSPQVKSEKSWNAKICLNFNFFWGGGILGTKSQNRVNWDFWTKFSTTPASLCFTDSLSHTTYVETKLVNCNVFGNPSSLFVSIDAAMAGMSVYLKASCSPPSGHS